MQLPYSHCPLVFLPNDKNFPYLKTVIFAIFRDDDENVKLRASSSCFPTNPIGKEFPWAVMVTEYNRILSYSVQKLFFFPFLTREGNRGDSYLFVEIF